MRPILFAALSAVICIGCKQAPKGPSQSDEVNQLLQEKRERAESFMNAQNAADEPQALRQDATAPPAAPTPAPPNPPATTPTPAKAVSPEEALKQSILTGSAKLAEDGLMTMETILKERTESPRLKKIISLMEQAASYSSARRKNHWRVTHNSDWRKVEEIIAPLLKAFSPKRKKRRAPVMALLRTGVEMVSRDDDYERSAGYALIHRCLKDVGPQLSQTEKNRFLMPLVSRFAIANPVFERRFLVEVLGTYGDRIFERFYVMAALTDTEWHVRREALNALSKCIEEKRGCGFDRPSAVLLNTNHEDSRTRAALYRLAGRAQIPDVVSWCAKHLDAGPLSQPCRKALSLVETREAFDVLYRWLKARKDTVESVAPGHYAFRDEFKTITPYADFHYAKDRFYTLLFEVLGQELRDPHATGGIVRSMASLKDTKRGLYIVRSTRAFYEAKWEKLEKQRSHKFLLAELDKMETVLTRRSKSKRKGSR